jgi:copper transport protein
VHKRFRYWPLLLLVALLLAPAPLVSAHPLVLRTEPVEGAQLAAPPAAVRVVFNEPIEAAFSSLQLLDAQRQPVATGGQRSATDPTVLELPLPQLGPGVYTALWQTVGSDGHAIKGNFAFAVQDSGALAAPVVQPTGPAATPTPIFLPTPLPASNNPAAPPDLPSAQAAEVPLWLVALLRALVLLGALGSVGGWLFAVGILLPQQLVSSTGDAAVVRRWRYGILLSVVLLLLATHALLVVHTISVGGALSGATLGAVVGSTRFGQALALRLLLALGFGALLLGVRRRSDLGGWRLALALLGGGGLLLTFSLSGHAAAQQASLPAVVADWLHLAATAVWVGGLLQLVLVLPPLLQSSAEEARPRVLAEVGVAFSSAALASVLVLAVSGTYTALLHLSAPADLVTSTYGRALLAKLALFGGLLALGAYNLLLIRPRFTAWLAHAAEVAPLARWQRRFQRTVRGEVVLATLVLLAVGVMTSTAPPDPRARASAPAAAPTVAAVARVSPVAATAQAPTTTATPSVASALSPSANAADPAPIPDEPFAQRQTIGDLQIGLAVEPVILGKNRFAITLADAAGRPVTAQRVLLDLEMQAMDMGVTEFEAVPQGDGRYSVDEGWLSMVGDWRARVLVRRADADDVEATFALVVPPLAMIDEATPIPPQMVGDISIGLQTAGAPEIYEGQQFIVTLTDAQGKAIAGADVYLELVMLEHPMGTNRPVALPLEPGTYRAEGTYTMTGRWGVTVVATVGGQLYRATFVATVRDQPVTPTPQ